MSYTCTIWESHIHFLSDQLINLIAGKSIAKPPSDDIQEYTCIYQDKDTHLIWKLHLLDTPEFDSDMNTLDAHLNTIQRKLRLKKL